MDRITLTVAGLAAFAAMLLAHPEADQPDQFSQASFPCAEDEVLAYSPKFGPDRVGCINWEEIK